MILSYFALSFSLAWCSFLQKEDISVDTWAMVEVEKAVVDTWDSVEEVEEAEAVVESWNSEEVKEKTGALSIETGDELESTIKDLINKRKEILWSGDKLTEKDIELMEDILNELIKAVK